MSKNFLMWTKMSRRVTYTNGLSLSNDNASESTSNNSNTVTNNIHITSGANPDLKVDYPSPYEEVKYGPQASDERTIDYDKVLFLEKVLDLYMNQSVYIQDKYIICTKKQLEELIHIITGGKVEIEVEDVELGCLGKPKIPYDKIVNIWIDKEDFRTVFKYDYAGVLFLFDRYKISLKFIHV